MLRRLSLRDFVIVDRLELEFESGFGALTGETGAGKSILLDALGLVLGDRGDSTVVRTGQSRAEMTAEFSPDNSALRAWLDEQGLQTEEASLILRRQIDSGGRSRAWINGTPVSLGQLKDVGAFLADIHGQHAHYALSRPETQRELLDICADAVRLADKVLVAYRQWQHLAELRRNALRDAAATEQERSLLHWQIAELEQLAFDSSEWEALNAEHARLSHAASLMQGTSAALCALDENDTAVCAILHRLEVDVAAMSAIDAELTSVAELLTSAAVQADEARQTLGRYRDRMELDPEKLSEIEIRIAAIHDTARKYRVSPGALPELLDQWRQRLEILVHQADAENLAEEEIQAERTYRKIAGELSAMRAMAARRLSDEITETMQVLAMTGGRFEVLLETCEASAHGLEKVEFQVAVNPGQPLRALSKVASGGELSRIGLAIQVMASRDAAVPTLIFDEVDVGIGGRVAEIVGQLLARLGKDRQVLCVTHLPQVAARADWQWQIAKEERDGETLSRVMVLDDAARVEEIARMLGGVSITETTRRHAAEMLEQR